ncbi:hypothetical protein [Kitasatospora sp. NPDC058218]|uniref:hypothetical protein n=1 Tax=Kitasatospora sp. NPDC058218 TaxID=3346385 RepID=UPI0036DE679D
MSDNGSDRIRFIGRKRQVTATAEPTLEERISAVVRVPAQREVVERWIACLERPGQHHPRDCPCLCRTTHTERKARRRRAVVTAAQSVLVAGGLVLGGYGLRLVVGGGSGLHWFAASAFLFGAATALQLFRPREGA